jgi:hypothetical protein
MSVTKIPMWVKVRPGRDIGKLLDKSSIVNKYISNIEIFSNQVKV